MLGHLLVASVFVRASNHRRLHAATDRSSHGCVLRIDDPHIFENQLRAFPLAGLRGKVVLRVGKQLVLFEVGSVIGGVIDCLSNLGLRLLRGLLQLLRVLVGLGCYRTILIGLRALQLVLDLSDG